MTSKTNSIIENTISCENKTSLYNKVMSGSTDIKNLYKIPIGKNKVALCSWKKQSNWTKEPCMRSAFICGKENNICVIDVDDYNMQEGNPFIEKFGKNYDEKFNTFIVKTTSGGKHIYFKYDKDLDRTAHNNDISIDFQSNGSYVVSPESDCWFKAEKHLPDSQRKTKQYQIIKDKPISNMPDNLKEFIIREVINKDKKKIKQDFKEKRQKKIKNNANIPFYKYNINKELVKCITEDIDDKLFQNYDSWWKLASAYKEIGFKDLFLKYSIDKAPFYKGQESKNEELYDSITQFNESNFIWLLKIYFMEENDTDANPDKNFIHTKNFINTYKCKDVYKQPNVIEVNEFIDVAKLGYKVKLNFGTDYIIKSDTGTGKTTLVKEFLRNIEPCYRFISITARISLASEQYRVFRKCDLSCKYYEYVKEDYNDFNESESICICVNSLTMLSRQDFTNTVVFLDEYNSLIEDVFCSPTMKDRILILNILIKIIKQSVMVVAVDADIQNHTLEFLQFCNKKPHFIQNDFQHNKNNFAKEWDTVSEMCSDMIKKDRWLLCSDSKTSSKTIFKQISIGDQMPLDKKEKKLIQGLDYYKDEKGIIVCVTAESTITTNFALDNFDRVIFSPKIIYGLDGTISRDIYCLYEEMTISPRAMNQQVNRCRNINQLNYVFLKNQFQSEKFIEMDDIYENIEKSADYSLFYNFASNEVIELYKKMASIIHYNNDSFSTNKKAHFVSRLRSAGWRVETSNILRQDRNNKDFKESKFSMKEQEYESFEELYKKHSDYIDSMNKCFKIPESDMSNFKNVYLDSQNARERNFNLGRHLFMNDTQLIENLKDKMEFNDKKFKNNKYKIAFLQQFMKECGCSDKLQFKVGPTNHFTQKEWSLVSDSTKKKYELMFKPTKRMLESKHNPIIKMMSDLFGTSVVENWSNKKSKENSIQLFNEIKTTINNKSVRIKQSINNDFIKKHMEVMIYRINNENKTLKKDIEFDLAFGAEKNNFDFHGNESEDICFIDDLE